MNDKKKSVTKRKGTTQKKSHAAKRKAASKSRAELADVLKKDLEDTKITLKALRSSARDEIALLKDLLDAALKREKELVKISEKKAKKMLVAGERWEKKQISNLKKAAEKARARIKK